MKFEVSHLVNFGRLRDYKMVETVCAEFDLTELIKAEFIRHHTAQSLVKFTD